MNDKKNNLESTNSRPLRIKSSMDQSKKKQDNVVVGDSQLNSNPIDRLDKSKVNLTSPRYVSNKDYIANQKRIRESLDAAEIEIFENDISDQRLAEASKENQCHTSVASRIDPQSPSLGGPALLAISGLFIIGVVFSIGFFLSKNFIKKPNN